MSILRGLKGLIKGASGFTKADSVTAFAKAHPLAAFGLIAPTVQFGAEDIVAPITQGFTEEYLPFEDAKSDSGQERLFGQLQESQSERIAKALEDKRMEDMVQRNMAAVARLNPHLYNQVMAGRVLPKGAVVLGGPRRQDLMEEMAYAMGTSSSPEDFTSLIS
tara:strand:- start:538 stop:1026 length:489 start_codon:yes stop_codon:yes gene_type:complete